MPCTYDDSAERAAAAEKQKKDLDEATRLLCELTANMAAAIIETVPGLRKWVDDHRKMDEDRRKREREAVAEDKKRKAARIKQLEAELTSLKKGK